MKVITTSAPGKIILSGEHAVVYGTEAIACSIDIRTECSGTILENCHQFLVTFPELNIRERWEMYAVHELCDDNGELVDEKVAQLLGTCDSKLQKMALHVVLHLYLIIAMQTFKTSGTGLSLSITTALPIGSGLGSSASLSVAVTSCLILLCDLGSVDLSAVDMKQINSYAYEGEKIVHGHPSGIDNTVLTYGHFLSFKGGKIHHLSDLNDIKLDVLIVNTNVTRSTKFLVQKVRSGKDKFFDVYESIFEAIGKVTESFKATLLKMSTEQNDIQSCFLDIEHLVTMNQHLLESIGVSHPKITKVMQICEAKSFACKLTGAGGGGCVVVFLAPNAEDEKIDALIEELSQLNCSSFRTSLGSVGVRVEKNTNS